MADFNIAIQKTLDAEGGDTITNDPDDSGGLTRYGISQRSYPELDISTITKQQAKDIYKKDYWDMVKGDALEVQTIAEAIFDFAVNAGPARAIKLAQKAINTEADGMIGPLTLTGWNMAHNELFLYKYAVEKIKFYRDIVTHNPIQKKYILGWINRSLEGL